MGASDASEQSGCVIWIGCCQWRVLLGYILLRQDATAETRRVGVRATRCLLPPRGREFGARASGSGDSAARLREEAFDEPSLEEGHGNRREDGQAAEGLDAPKRPVKHCVLRQGQRCDALGSRRDTDMNVQETQRLQWQQSKSERVQGFMEWSGVKRGAKGVCRVKAAGMVRTSPGRRASEAELLLDVLDGLGGLRDGLQCVLNHVDIAWVGV